MQACVCCLTPLYPLNEILVSNPLKSIIPVFLLHVLYHTSETPVGLCSFPLHRTFFFSKGLQVIRWSTWFVLLNKKPDSMPVYLLLQEGNEAGGWRQWQWWFLPSNQLTAILCFRRRQKLCSVATWVFCRSFHDGTKERKWAELLNLLTHPAPYSSVFSAGLSESLLQFLELIRS